jgi:hypothetical protein
VIVEGLHVSSTLGPAASAGAVSVAPPVASSSGLFRGGAGGQQQEGEGGGERRRARNGACKTSFADPS